MEHSEQHKVIKICVTICRFVLAGVFVFSGFVKTIDDIYHLAQYEQEIIGIMPNQADSHLAHNLNQRRYQGKRTRNMVFHIIYSYFLNKFHENLN